MHRVPGEVHFGLGVAAKVPEIVARFGRRPFVVTGSRPAPFVLGDAVSGLSIASLVVFLAISWMLSRKLEQAIEADARRNP